LPSAAAGQAVRIACGAMMAVRFVIDGKYGAPFMIS
jgi:hypothetical protein